MSTVNSQVKFGYRVSKDRQIDFDANDFSVLEQVREAEPSIALCISCGTCASTCTAARLTEFSLRKIILLVRRGETQGLSEEASRCQMCGKCVLVCPRGVNTRNLILQVNKALQKGKP